MPNYEKKEKIEKIEIIEIIEIIELMSSRFYKDFAKIAAEKIIEQDAIEALYQLATGIPTNISLSKRNVVIFRSAYTLEYIYFNYKELFIPYINRFCNDFALCENQSARRHFTKMMADLLLHHTPNPQQLDSIANAVACWISEPKTKVAVKIWCMCILKTLQSKVLWINDIWEDLEAIATKDFTPGISVRFKKGWD